MNFVALEKSLTVLGLRHLRRIVDGWQSIAVYEATVDGRRVAVKVVDPVLVDRASLEVRLTALTRLAATDERVCGPVALRGRLVNEIDPDVGLGGGSGGGRCGSDRHCGAGLGAVPGPGFGRTDEIDEIDELALIDGHHTVFAPVDGERRRGLVTVAYDFAVGEAPDVNRPRDAHRMGRSLAQLHQAMATLPTYVLPGLAAFPPLDRLEKVADDLGVPVWWLAEALPDDGAGPRQLLHGDFSSKNMRVDSSGWRIFDFDDCGYGPVELDLANSVYFVLFDATLRHDIDRYHRFRASFVEGYDSATVAPRAAPNDARIDALITRRVLALASWLADPAHAPSGIRTASPEWRATLHDFVRRYLGTFEATGALG